MTLPTFLIIGAAKSGTTSLYRYLEQHPDVYMSPVKETLFFAPDCWTPAPDGSQRGIRTLEDYEALFAPAADCPARGEASPQYLFSREAPARIKALLPDARLIATLRNPAERAYSAFLHLVRDGIEPFTDFREALAAEPERRASGADPLWLYQEVGLYADQLTRYYEHFPAEQVRVYLYEDFARDPAGTTKDALRFIGVDDDGFRPDTTLRFNPGGLPRSRQLHRLIGVDSRLRAWALRRLPPAFGTTPMVKAVNRNLVKPAMPADVRRELEASLRPSVERLQDLLQRDLSSWMA